MLPVETFAEVVSFLGYYDLGGLKLSSKRLSAVATQCADAICVFDFSDFEFVIHSSWINIYRFESDRRTWTCRLELHSEKALADFVSEAFRNCTVGSVEMWVHRTHVVNAVTFMAKITAAADRAALPDDYLEKKQKGFYWIETFCRVERSITLGENKLGQILSQRKNIVLHR